MGRTQRVRKESLKKREMDEAMKLPNRSLIRKRPTKMLVRSTGALQKAQLDEGRKEMAGGPAAGLTDQTARAAINADVPSTSTMFIPTASPDAPCSSSSMSGTPLPPQPIITMIHDGETINVGSSVAVNIESLVERKHEKARAQRGEKDASASPPFMMDPVAKLKNPKVMLITPSHPGLPLPGFVKKSCSVCQHMIRDYIVAKVRGKNGEELTEEEGYETFYTSQMCSNPDCMDEPKTVTTRKLPKELTGSSLYGDSMLTDEETASALKYVDKVDGNYVVRPHPNPDRDVVMRLVSQYQASGRQKLQIPRLAPPDAYGSDNYLDQMLKTYEEEAKKKK